MINILFFIIVSIYAYISIFLLHEACHCWEALRQGCYKPYISVRKSSPFMMAFPGEGLCNWRLFGLAGGLYSGLITAILGFTVWFLAVPEFYIPFFTMAVLQLCYGFFEMKYIKTLTMKYRYIIYLVVIVVMAVFWWVVL